MKDNEESKNTQEMLAKMQNDVEREAWVRAYCAILPTVVNDSGCIATGAEMAAQAADMMLDKLSLSRANGRPRC